MQYPKILFSRPGNTEFLVFIVLNITLAFFTQRKLHTPFWNDVPFAMYLIYVFLIVGNIGYNWKKCKHVDVAPKWSFDSIVFNS